MKRHFAETPECVDAVEYARQILRTEAAALESVASRLDASYQKIVDRLASSAVVSTAQEKLK